MIINSNSQKFKMAILICRVSGVCRGGGFAERKNKSPALKISFLFTDTAEDRVLGSAAEQLKQRSLRGGGIDSQLSQGTIHDCGGRSVSASLLVWSVALETAYGWGITPP